MTDEYHNTITVWGVNAGELARLGELARSQGAFSLRVAVPPPEGRLFPPSEAWAINNWGCKGDVIFPSVRHEVGAVVLSFTSPDEPPTRAIEALSKKFGSLNFALSYSCVESGVVGCNCICNGVIVRDLDYEFEWGSDHAKYRELRQKYDRQDNGNISRGWPALDEVGAQAPDAGSHAPLRVPAAGAMDEE